MTNGQMTPMQIAQALEQVKANEAIAATRHNLIQAVGNVMIATLQNFMPDVNLGMDVLVSVLGATIANNNIDVALVEKALHAAVTSQREMRKVLQASQAAQAGGTVSNLVGLNGAPIRQVDEAAPETAPETDAQA